jgi:hypothetical protein
MFAAVIALNAYSVVRLVLVDVDSVAGDAGGGERLHTNLVKATLVREDGDVSIEACAACMDIAIS